MRLRPLAGVVVLLSLVASACVGSSATVPSDEYGNCTVRPRADCRDQDLRSATLASADMRGIDLSGADLFEADLRSADLSNAKLVGANLTSTNLTDADLSGADLSNSKLVGTILRGATMDGAVTAGAQRCALILPNGLFEDGECGSFTNPGPAAPTVNGPPSIESLRLVPPGRCLNDAAGTGIELEWSARNITGVTFLVDSIRVGGNDQGTGTARVPFVCDGKPHTVTMQAYGPTPPLVSKSLTLTREPGRPPSPEDE